MSTHSSAIAAAQPGTAREDLALLRAVTLSLVHMGNASLLRVYSDNILGDWDLSPVLLPLALQLVLHVEKGTWTADELTSPKNGLLSKGVLTRAYRRRTLLSVLAAKAPEDELEFILDATTSILGWRSAVLRAKARPLRGRALVEQRALPELAAVLAEIGQIESLQQRADELHELALDELLPAARAALGRCDQNLMRSLNSDLRAWISAMAPVAPAMAPAE